jgi:hypothetical protein
MSILPRRSPAFRFAGSVLVAILLAAVAGCGGSNSTQLTAASGASSAPSGTAVATASAPVVDAGTEVDDPEPTRSSQATPRVRVLPVSVLAPIGGIRYSRIKGSKQVAPELEDQAEFWEGTITRKMTYQGVVAGTVQLFRLRRGVDIDQANRAYNLRIALKEYTQQKKFIQVRIAGQKVLTATDVRDTGGSVAGWFKGRDLVIIFAAPRLSARKFAVSYLTGKSPLD